MQIAILSDIHDNVWKLAATLKHTEDADALICCGDLCSPFVIDELAVGFSRDIHIVFGNNDADLFRITSKIQHFPHVHLHGELFTATFDGKKFAVNHFDYIARPLAKSKEYDVVCFGHNHIFEMTRQDETWLLNPGSILGAEFVTGTRRDTASSFLLYDTQANEPTGFEIDASLDVKRRRL